MMTYEKRVAMLHKVANDPLIGFKDTSAFIYHWMMNEYALNRRARAHRSHQKHGSKLRDLSHIFNAIHELQDL
jgi:hypothetical protein